MLLGYTHTKYIVNAKAEQEMVKSVAECLAELRWHLFE